MFKYICQKSAESLQKCGDFQFVVLMFEGLHLLRYYYNPA
jgi:hypothetical protein